MSTDGAVNRLNYSTHAIDDIRSVAKYIKPNAPETAANYLALAELLETSVKFILPNCSELVAPEEIKQKHLDLVRLPFPCVAFEAPWEKDTPAEVFDGFPQSISNRRIALCWELSEDREVIPGTNSVLNQYPTGGIFVVPIYWTSESSRWTVALGGAFYPYENTLRELNTVDALPASKIAAEAAIEAGIDRNKEYSVEPFVLSSELRERTKIEYGGDIEKVYAQILLDSRDEVSMLVQACSVLNCSNVDTSEIPAPKALNKKRRAKGKLPFFSYKVLDVKSDRIGSSGEGRGSDRSGPRMHLRRGHLRQLESHSVWVRASMVNAGSKDGVVVKDYSIHSGQKHS